LACMAYTWRKLVAGESLCWSILHGWAVYGVAMVGHESYHNTMAPSRRANEALGFLTMDCLITSKETWKYAHHAIHHRTPYSESPMDRQRLFGCCLLVETLNMVYTVLEYWAWDLASLLKAPTAGKAIGMAIRFWLILKLPLNSIVAFVFSLACMLNYNALLAHAVPVVKKTQDGVVRQLRTSLDIFPDSFFCIFLTGALNNHCVHHVFPSLPRALHCAASAKLARLYPDEYRVVNDFATLGALWVLRATHFDRPVRIAELTKLSEGKWVGQLFLDLGSVLVLAAVAAALPAFRLV